jgi:hypothetical protein
MVRFEAETLSTKENLNVPMDLSGPWIDQAHQHRKLPKLILEMPRSVSELNGHQEASDDNGQFGCTSYHRLFRFNQFSDARGQLPASAFLAESVAIPLSGG